MGEPGHFPGERAWNFHWLLEVSVGHQELRAREIWAQLFPRREEAGPLSLKHAQARTLSCSPPLFWLWGPSCLPGSARDSQEEEFLGYI